MTEVMMFGQTYKVGLNGKVYRESCGDWLLTINFTAHEVLAAIADEEVKSRRKTKERNYE